MSERKLCGFNLFSIVAAVGLALWGAVAYGQDRVPAFTKAASVQGIGNSSDGSGAGQPKLGLFNLPGAAQPVVSNTLGREDVRYKVERAGGTLSADNPAQSLRVEFTPSGLDLRTGRTHWRLTLDGYGYGNAIQRTRAAAPQSRDNRVEYDRGPLVEWYANGPLGLEQGFTLTEPPARDNNKSKSKNEPLTIAFTLGGDLRASADSPAKRPLDTARDLTLRDRNGQAALRYAGLTAHDASGQNLQAWLELNGKELRLRVDDAAARYPVVVDPFIQRAKLTASDGGAGDQFGVSVAISSDGNTIVVGADGAKIGSNSLQGAAYVFVKPSSGWNDTTETARLTASDGAAGDLFGGSVAISGDGSIIVAGSLGAAIGSNAAQGAAYVFVMPPAGWMSATETAKLTAADGMAHDVFGVSVAISSDGSTIGAGAIGADIGLNSDQGAAYVFLRPATGWASETATVKLIASDGAPNDSLGVSMAISGDGSVIVSGAPASFSPGAAYVFVRPPTGWLDGTESAKLIASDAIVAVADVFGDAASISDDGSTIVVGTPQATVGSNFHQGAAYVFVEPRSGWASSTETAKLIASDGAPSDKLGSVRISGDGNVIAAGAVRATVGSNLLQGATYIFVKPSSGWTSTTETSKLTASDGGAKDLFGSSIALSSDGSTMMITASGSTIGTNSGQGSAYVFLAAPLASPSPNALGLGSQAVGTISNAQIVTLTNSGNAPLHVTSVTATSGFLTTTNCVTASPVAVGATCTESVSFAPTTVGALTGDLTFTDDSNGTAGNTQEVSLTGTGVKASTTTIIISVVPSPSVVGEAVNVNVTVSPQAGDTLTPGGMVTVNASTGESCVGSAPSSSCSLLFLTNMVRTITASYGGDANFAGSISAGVTQTVQDFTLISGPPSETISAGHKATYNVMVTAINGLSGTVSLGCSGGPPNSTCIVSPSTVNVSGSANATVSVAGSSSMKHGTFTLTFTGTFGSGNPATGGLTRTTSVSMTVK